MMAYGLTFSSITFSAIRGHTHQKFHLETASVSDTIGSRSMASSSVTSLLVSLLDEEVSIRLM